MTKFRFHRGSLAESLATTVEFTGIAALVEIINDSGWPPGKIEIKPHGGIDERIGWDTHMVLVDNIPVGFTDGPILK